MHEVLVSEGLLGSVADLIHNHRMDVDSSIAGTEFLPDRTPVLDHDIPATG